MPGLGGRGGHSCTCIKCLIYFLNLYFLERKKFWVKLWKFINYLNQNVIKKLNATKAQRLLTSHLKTTKLNRTTAFQFSFWYSDSGIPIIVSWFDRNADRVKAMEKEREKTIKISSQYYYGKTVMKAETWGSQAQYS